MTLLTPLGLLGLLGIVVLIIIYIIKPNYQQKFVSTTFVWQLSLKRRRKKLPVSKLRNLLIIICQILILTLCAAILTTPSLVLRRAADYEEAVIIIDSSASMRTETEGTTRFERAVEGAAKRAQEMIVNGGVVSVVIADGTPAYLARRVSAAASLVTEPLMELIEDGYNQCAYGSSNIDEAISMCSDILDENPSVKFYVYTDNEYYYYDKDMISVINVSNLEEWNAGILNASSELEDGLFKFDVDVASYGVDTRLNVTVEVFGANKSSVNVTGSSHSFSYSIDCKAGVENTVVFTTKDGEQDTDTVFYYALGEGDRIYSYDYVNVTIDSTDSFADDDSFYIYGGSKPVLKVQYCSSNANIFVNGALMTLAQAYANSWDIRITEINDGEPITEGFDLYIFEHVMPTMLPNDGVVVLFDPNLDPVGAGFRVIGQRQLASPTPFTTDTPDSPFLKNMDAEKIEVTKYTQLASYNDYDVLMECNGSPMMLVKNTADQKVVVLPFSIHYSNIAILLEFPMMLNNMLQQFFPTTVSGNAFEVGANIGLNSRGPELQVSGGGLEEELVYNTFPASIVTDMPGTYTLRQVTFFGKEEIENIYVKIPAKESNIWNVEDSIVSISSAVEESDFYDDLLFYLALALVFFLFAEWLLHTKENA